MSGTRPCPGAESLAAFVDGGLPDAERARLVAHLADCDTCRHLVADVLVLQEAMGGGEVRPGRAPVSESVPRAIWWPSARGMAIAVAALAVISLVPIAYFELAVVSSGAPFDRLAAATPRERTIEPRVSGRFAYAPLGAPSRAAGDGAVIPAPWRLVAAAGQVREDFHDDLTADGRRAVGVAALLVGDFDGAVQALEEASSAAPSDARVLSDLAAAFHERARVGGRPDDLPRALDAAERAVAADPSLPLAWFNRALAITAFNLRDQAIEAWTAYLSHDSTSPWADEARAHIAALRAPTAADQWPAVRVALTGTPSQSEIDDAVRRHTSRVRELVEHEVLPAWAGAVLAGGDAAVARERLRAFADALARLASDQLYASVVAEIDRAEATGRVRPLATAVAAYAKAAAIFAEDRFADAAAPLAASHRLLQSVGSVLAWRPALDLAAVDYYGGRLDAAETRLARVEPAARQGGYIDIVGRATWLRGMVAFSQGNLGAAQYQYEQSLDAFASGGDQEQVAGAHGRLASLFHYVGDAQQTWSNFVAGLRLVGSIADPRSRQRLLLAATAAAQGVGTPAAALPLQQAALAASAVSTSSLVVDLYAQRALILMSLGRDSEAAQALAAAHRTLEAVADDTLRSRLRPRLLMAEAEVALKTNPAAAQRILGQIDLGSSGQEPLLVSRYRLLAADAQIALGQFGDAEKTLADGIAAFEAQRLSLSDEGRLAYSERAWALFERAIELEVRRGNLAAAFDLSERARARSLLETKKWGSSAIPSVTDVRNAIDPATGILVINQFEDHVVLWLLTRSDIRSAEVPITRERATALVGRQAADLADPVGRPRASAELFDALIRPLLGTTEGLRSLVVVPDTPYQAVSFAGLFDQTRRRFLVQDSAVTVAPSATVYLRALRRIQRARHAESALVLGAPLATPGVMVPTLPGAAQEASAVAALYPQAELRTGAMATPSRLLNEGPMRDVIHVGAHALPNGQYPLLSRLLLADEPGRPYSGALLATRVAAEDFSHTQMVVLAACESAAGTAVRGEGAMSLARAFLAAGTPTVVSALGPLDDAQAQPLFVELHRRYAAGAPVAEALREVQLQAIAQQPGRLGAWAGLAVFGASN
ncbi:MAG: CHAT domain-containing protein [Vicinamibacterales bacterium]